MLVCHHRDEEQEKACFDMRITTRSGLEKTRTFTLKRWGEVVQYYKNKTVCGRAGDDFGSRLNRRETKRKQSFRSRHCVSKHTICDPVSYKLHKTSLFMKKKIPLIKA